MRVYKIDDGVNELKLVGEAIWNRPVLKVVLEPETPEEFEKVWPLVDKALKKGIDAFVVPYNPKILSVHEDRIDVVHISAIALRADFKRIPILNEMIRKLLKEVSRYRGD